MKRLVQSALLALVALALGLWAWGRFANSADTASPGEATVSPALTAHQDSAATEVGHVVVVTYFTSDVRCPTCRTIEALTRRTVEERFTSELAAGTVVFETRNLDEPENAHFAGNYQLSFKTVVVSDRLGHAERTWEKFDDVWSHADDPEAFMVYLEEGIRAYIDASDG